MNAEGIEGLGSERERVETAVFTDILGGLRLYSRPKVVHNGDC
jgi:hypothetical protein